MRTLLRLIVIVFISISSAEAAFTPLAVSILSPVQFPPEDFTVVGARVSALWGDHRMVYGLDLGAVGNMTDLDMGGVQVSGLFNLNKGTATVLGLQAAGIANVNVNKTRVFGLQVAAGVNYNVAESSVAGLQIALGNYSPFTKIYGFQLGIYNRAQVVSGFQIGLINVTQSLHGLQIGLLNFNTMGLFAVSPILNIGF